MKRILIADDSASGRELIRTMLAHSLYDIAEAGDGIEAVVEAIRFQPDLVILDIHMPALDGYEVARALRGMPKFANTPILALTGTAKRQDPNSENRSPFTAFLTKPIRLQELRGVVQKFLPQDPAKVVTGPVS